MDLSVQTASSQLKSGDDATTEQQMDEELSKADEYSLEFIIMKENASKLLERDMPVLPSADSHCSDPSLKNALNYKLPKMKFRQFRGEIKDWFPFWDQFHKIHNEEKMDPSDKLHYLSMSITPNSVAKEVVEVFLPLPRYNCGPILMPLVSSCLPAEILRTWKRKGRGAVSSSKVMLESLLKFLKYEVEADQKIAMSLDGFGLTVSHSPRVEQNKGKTNNNNRFKNCKETTQRKVPTVAGLLTTVKDEHKGDCIFYSSGHRSQEFKIKHGNHERIIRALLDSASQKSYMPKSTAKEMGYLLDRCEPIQHALFGGYTTEATQPNAYTITLSSLEGDYTYSFEAIDHHIIYGNIAPILSGPWLKELKLYNIYLSDVNTDGAIEVLLDTDVVESILTGRKKEVRNGMIAFQTKLGWTLMGKVSKDTNNCKGFSMNFLSLKKKIPEILTRFRMNKLGIVAHIRRAFLQLSIVPEDRDYLRFFWETTDGRAIIYRHCRVVFGVSPSPFQLAASIEYRLGQVLAKCKSGVRDLSVDLVERLKGSFYVDNCFTSLDTQEDCLEFNTNNEVSPGNVLGLLWNRKTDTLEINIGNLSSIRIILSATHRILDPCGMVCDVSPAPKLLLQRTWEQGTIWDQEVDPEISARFMTWMEEIRLLSNACLTSYGSAVLSRVASREGVRLQLVFEKARVAPIKKPSKSFTIPRLELLAASISGRLYKSIAQYYELDDIKTTFWTDYTTVLAWIGRCDPWDAYVYNRVKEIRQLTCGQEWRHVPGTMNPADLVLRGSYPKKFLSTRWWEGPSWLRQPEETWPQPKLTYNGGEINNWFCQYKKIVRLIEWMLRFFNNGKTRQHIKGELTAQEYNAAEMRVLLLVQQQAFDGVFDKRLKTLLPFTDGNDLIRIKTKVSNRADVNDFCYPIVLPNHEHPVVFRLILDWHRDNSYAGMQMMTSIMRQRYWIIRGRKTARLVLSKCIRCKRHNVKRSESVPAPLPEARVRDAKVFEVTGTPISSALKEYTTRTTQDRIFGTIKIVFRNPKELSVGEIVLIGNDDSKRTDCPLQELQIPSKEKTVLADPRDDVVEQQCIRSLNLNERTLKLTSRQSDTPEDNEEYGKFYVCIWKGRGIMNDEGAIVKESVEQFLRKFFYTPLVEEEYNKALLSKVNELCVPIKESNEGHTAIKFKNCMVQIINEHAGL
ncbi:hypothetical protein ILUMI_05237 [Ignelater luminosus]|uniref:Integrase zinc-binding domain-containing protein n=1 Tax=Ignelater luminosus TaxID=2038154 RepID=A0A8K0DBE7_IGNLU|nr:hypothetical protein ILUMI_05237 [Ignelater luminosus]